MDCITSATQGRPDGLGLEPPVRPNDAATRGKRLEFSHREKSRTDSDERARRGRLGKPGGSWTCRRHACKAVRQGEWSRGESGRLSVAVPLSDRHLAACCRGVSTGPHAGASETPVQWDPWTADVAQHWAALLLHVESTLGVASLRRCGLPSKATCSTFSSSFRACRPSEQLRTLSLFSTFLPHSRDGENSREPVAKGKSISRQVGQTKPVPAKGRSCTPTTLFDMIDSSVNNYTIRWPSRRAKSLVMR